jgi:hypothetical protein
MLVIKVEIWPFGSQAHKRTLGEMHIVNDGTERGPFGNYDVCVWNGDDHDFETEDPPAMTGRVEKYKRMQRDVWTLLVRALESLPKTASERKLK